MAAICSGEMTISASSWVSMLPHRKTLGDMTNGLVTHGKKPDHSTVLTPGEDNSNSVSFV